jgi:HK97 family phage major capsid protein
VTNAAAVVAAGAAKPESAKALALKTSPVVKVAHTLTVPDEFLDDADGLAAYLDANMGAGVLAVLDKQILTGSGAAGQIQGLLTLPGRTADVAAAAGEGMAAIATAAANVWTATRRRPDTVVVNPATYNVIWFPTGNKAAQVSPPPFDMVVVPSPDMPAGQAIVGAFKLGGMVFQRGGVATQAANTHADYFQKNQTMIRSEIRVAVVYFVPAAFCLVTGVSVSA